MAGNTEREDDLLDRYSSGVVFIDGYTCFYDSNYNALIAEYKPEQPTSYLKVPTQLCDEDSRVYKVNAIGSAAFFTGVELETVEIPDGIEIVGDMAFVELKKLKTVVMADSVKEVGEKAFSGCANLTTIRLSNSIKKISNSAFFSCENLETIVLPDGVEEISETAFGLCKKLVDLILPLSLKRIGIRAFTHCDRLESLFIPSFVEYISPDAFHGCDVFANIEVDSSNERFFSAQNCVIERGSNKLVLGTNGSVIPYGVTEIADRAFYGQHNIKSISIPESVTRIGNEAFANCYGLWEIFIPKSVIEMGDGVFNECIGAHLRCKAGRVPDGWSRNLGVKFDRIELNSQLTPYTEMYKPKKPRESIFKKIKRLFSRK